MLDFDPLYSTSTLDTAAEFLGRHYPLETPLRCQLLNRGLNDVYDILAGDGAHYVFRLSHRRARGSADVQTETRFLDHIARLGVPVARAVPGRDGAMFVSGTASDGEREGVLFDAVGGRSPQMTSSADARANGVTLAKLHVAAESFDADAASYRLDLDHLLRRPLARIFDSGIVEDKNLHRDFEEIAERTAAGIEAFQDLSWTYCHGDCHGLNAHISETGEAVFFDFDDGGPGYLAYDLSVFLWAKVSFGRTQFSMWHAFIDGYRTIRPITPDDFEATHWFVIVRHIWLMGEYASRLNEWGKNPISWISREVDFLQNWETDRLSERLF